MDRLRQEDRTRGEDLDVGKEKDPLRPRCRPVLTQDEGENRRRRFGEENVIDQTESIRRARDEEGNIRTTKFIETIDRTRKDVQIDVDPAVTMQNNQTSQIRSLDRIGEGRVDGEHRAIVRLAEQFNDGRVRPEEIIVIGKGTFPFFHRRIDRIGRDIRRFPHLMETSRNGHRSSIWSRHLRLRLHRRHQFGKIFSILFTTESVHDQMNLPNQDHQDDQQRQAEKRLEGSHRNRWTAKEKERREYRPRRRPRRSIEFN